MSLEDELATLSLHLVKESKTPLYRQLKEQIGSLITTHRLEAGQRLPSTRKLAQLLNVSRTSVINTYDQLIAEGFLVSRPSSGVYVTTLAMGDNTHTNIATSKSQQEEDEITENHKHHTYGSFNLSADAHLFPFSEWAKSSNRLWRKNETRLLQSFPPGGYAPLRAAITHYVKVMKGIDCLPEQVIITAGNRDALSLITMALLKEKEPVALEDPCYSPLRYGLGAQAYPIEYCPVDEQGATLPHTRVQLAWLTAARQYPLGTSMSTERRLQWLAYAQQHSTYLVEDDFDSEYHYQKTPLAPLFSLSANRYPTDQQSVIFTGSFSKVLFKTLRIGFIIVPEPLIKRFHIAQRQLGDVASLPTQAVLAEFLGNRRFFSHLRKMKKVYQQRRDFLHNTMVRELGDIVNVSLPHNGMHLLATYKTTPLKSDTAVQHALATYGIHVSALSQFYTTQGPQGLLLGFSGSTEEQLAMAVSQLKRVIY